MKEPHVLHASPDVPAPWFDGSPVWMVNLPLILRCAAAEIALVAVLAVATFYTRFWWVLAILLLAPLAVAAQAAAMTRATRIVIDAERMTVTTGIAIRQTVSVELTRVQNVRAITPLWQAGLGFGTLHIETSDAFHPVWDLPGFPDAADWREHLTRYSVALRIARGIRDVNIGQL
ncbi:PH domain-containing protein [Paraburkholderia megapolitana]|uniref:PH domain-containing protein n=1 Tax=Paraburkholderia megapolitana TaxID=420953 RepID=UPI0038B951FF